MISSIEIEIPILTGSEDSWIVSFLNHERSFDLVHEPFLVKSGLIIDEEVRRELVEPVINSICDGKTGTDSLLYSGETGNRL